jgi:hypothetical protein
MEALEVAEIAYYFSAAIHLERRAFFGLEQFEMLQHDASGLRNSKNERASAFFLGVI